MNTTAPKVLIAEDERPLARALTLKLQREGYDPHTVMDGDAACSALNETTFAVLILDLVMPKKNGFEVLEFMKDNDIDIPTIVLSNLSQEEDMGRARELGAHDVFIKANTSLSDIVGHVQAILSQK